MAYVSVDTLKHHLNIDAEFTEDDEYLAILEDVAEKTVARNICCVLADMEDGEGKIPSPLCQAIMLYAGVLYNSREAISYGGSPVQVPLTFDYLIGLYKNYADTTSDHFVYSILDDLALATDMIQDSTKDTYGDVVIDTDLKRKAVDRIAQGTEIDENGNYTTNIERI